MSTWVDTLKSLAPTVASAMLGPLGGVAVSALGELFGVSDATKEKLSDLIQSGQLTPEQVGKLKELELQYQEQEKERGFKYSELEFADTASARIRDTELVKAVGHNYRADALAILAICIILWLVWIIWKSTDLNEYVKGIFTFVLGRFTGYVDLIYSFEFGSNRMSKVKDDTIARMSKKE